jgi:hypothetical protein
MARERCGFEGEQTTRFISAMTDQGPVGQES